MFLFRFLVAAGFAASAAAAPSAPVATAAPGVATTTPAPVVAAAPYLWQDTASGQAIVEENADARRDPASLTKLMTAYVTFGALRDGKLTASPMVPVSQGAWR